LLVDATQGIQAQTLANFYIAFSQGLEIIPAVNKIDMATADPDAISKQITNAFDKPSNDICLVSAKSGLGVEPLIHQIIQKIPPPVGSVDKAFKSLLFDCTYDKYLGVVCLIAVQDGAIGKGDYITSYHNKRTYQVASVGIMNPDLTPTTKLTAGQVGYVTMNMKHSKEANVGDTFFQSGSEVEPFPGFHPINPMVWAGMYPADSNDYGLLQQSLEKLIINDSSVSLEKESSDSLGQGFRLGFLGTLHMDVFRERLEQEYNAVVINTAPTVPFIVRYKSSSEIKIRNPAEFPDNKMDVDSFLEPMIIGTIVFPSQYLGTILELCIKHRGEQQELTYLDENRIMLKFKFPMSEVLVKFYDSLKSRTSGYATFDYEDAGYQESDIVKINIMLNSKPVDSLSCIVHSSQAQTVARDWVKRLKGVLSRQLFEVVIQAAANNKILARESIKPVRKDVTAKCYGGDMTRKRKLLDKQKAGKKRMKVVGGVELSQEAFLSLIKSDT
jgi:elongation factor 4